MAAQDIAFVPETRFGFWFLGTGIWTTRVVRVALKDLERLIPERRASYAVILDAGCGQGKSFRPLIEHFAPQRLIGVDADAESLHLAAAESAKEHTPIELRHGDVADLALPDASVDLVFCHQTFHHLIRQEETLAQFHRVLKPGGLLLFSTFGPDTLGELRDAWSQAGDDSNHVNHFFDPHAIGSALMHAGLAEPVLDVDRIVVGYDDAIALMRELKAIGAHNVTRGRARGLTGRRRLAAMTRAYEALRSDGKLPATWEVIHASAWGGPRREHENERLPRETLISPGSIRRRGP